MKTTTLTILCILLFGGTFLLYACGEGTKNSNEAKDLLSPKSFVEGLEKDKATLQLVDVRKPEEYNEGHLAGAKLIDFYEEDFKTQLEVLDKNRPVYLYCRSGRRSHDTQVMMKEMGFQTVYDLDGGIIAWQEAGMPVEQ